MSYAEGAGWESSVGRQAQRLVGGAAEDARDGGEAGAPPASWLGTGVALSLTTHG